MKPIRIGCWGWNYKHWRDGVFYPPQLPPRRFNNDRNGYAVRNGLWLRRRLGVKVPSEARWSPLAKRS